MAKTKKKDKTKSAEKKAQKQEKQARKADKKAAKGEDFEDLEKLLDEFKEMDKKLTTVSETVVAQPGIRASASLVASVDSDLLYLFGGEHNKGNKTFVYNDLFIYKIKQNTWSKLFIPNPPPPRSGHQSILTPSGQLWIFGGEFSSPNGGQFYHYKDMWMLDLKASKNDQKWEQVPNKVMKNGPSARSGHRMCYHDKKIYLFGGFNERTTEFIYYNDLYSFDITNFIWTKIIPSNPTNAPCPRSACQFTSISNGLSVFGGYSKKHGKRKDEEFGNLAWDGHFYNFKTNSWHLIKQSGNFPTPRSSFCTTSAFGHNEKLRLFFFGGVLDEDNDDDLESEFLNDLFIIDSSSNKQFRWFPGVMRSLSEYEPCPRMSAICTIKDNVIYMFGGAFEEGNSQITLNDFWSLDLKKMNGWQQINESDEFGSEWVETESESDDDEMDIENENEQNFAENFNVTVPESKKKKTKKKKQDKTKWKNGKSVSTIYDNHPRPVEDEDFEFYFMRTKEYWLELMVSASMDVLGEKDCDEETRADITANAAGMMAKAYYKNVLK